MTKGECSSSLFWGNSEWEGGVAWVAKRTLPHPATHYSLQQKQEFRLSIRLRVTGENGA